MKTAIILLAGLAAAAGGAVLFGAQRWQSRIQAFRGQMAALQTTIEPAAYDERELDGLPPPVQRYFRAVLRDGQPIIAAAHLAQQGQFRLNESAASWRPYTADQLVTTRRPGFDWDARIQMAPGVTVFVQDAYSDGAGILQAAIFGLVTVARAPDTPEIAAGEMMRYLAEAPWYPTALLPSQGVTWEPIDESRARATLADGERRVSIEFTFDDDGLITSTWAPARYRMIGDGLQAAPWRGRFWHYVERHGVRLPAEGAVEWVLPEGALPYWQGQITAITFEYAR